MEIFREFNSRAHGPIGEVTFIAPDGDYTLDGKVLPVASVNHLLTFALQSLQDAYAGAKDSAECIGAFEGKRDKLFAGTLGTRGGEGVSFYVTVARQIMRGIIKAKLGAKSAEWAAFTGLEPAEQNAKLDENFAANETALKSAVEAEIETRKAKAAQKAALGKGMTINI